MPMTWTIEDGLLVVNLIGTHELDEFRDTISEAVASPGFRPGMHLFFDARSSYSYLTPEAIQRRLEFLATLVSKGVATRCAVVTTQQRAGISIRAAAKLEAFGMVMGVFLDKEEARTWLREPLADRGQAS
jgi:O-methyltransferase involved in polyketide biosynthesis